MVLAHTLGSQRKKNKTSKVAQAEQKKQATLSHYSRSINIELAQAPQHEEEASIGVTAAAADYVSYRRVTFLRPPLERALDTPFTCFLIRDRASRFISYYFHQRELLESRKVQWLLQAPPPCGM